MERSKSQKMPVGNLKPIGLADSTVKKKKKRPHKLPKIKSAKLTVENLLVKSISSVGISDTFTVSNDKIETSLKYERMRDADHHSHYSDDEDTHSNHTFSLTSPEKYHSSATAGDLSINSQSGRGSSLFSHDDYSLGSSGSVLSQLTSHELVAQINRRALKNQPPPEFVPLLRTMDPGLLSWNHRLPANHNPDNPPINIVACQVPLEVILAKADRRIRRRAKICKEREKIHKTRVHELEESLELKRTRAERIAAKLAAQQFQCSWMRMLVVARYLAKIRPQYEHSLRMQRDWWKAVSSARLVQKLFFRWYYREIRARLQRKYLGAFGRVECSMKLHLRIFRKRMAIKKLKKFLVEFKGQHKMSVVVHRFLHSVRKIQRNMRDFINCKLAKVVVLGKIWDKIELSFIRKKLEQRKARIAGTMMSKKSLDKDLKSMNSKALDEIKDKEREWHKIHKQMEKVVHGLRATGVIVEETEDQVIDKLRIPEATKHEILRSLLEKLRKAFYSDQRTQLKKKIEQDSCFNEAHAANLLLGDGKEVMRLFREKFNKKLVNLQYKPFMLFSSLDRRLIFEKVKEAHTTRETFKIKVDKFS